MVARAGANAVSITRIVMLKRDRSIVVLLVAVSIIATGALTLTPDVTYKTVSKVQFGGAMGRAVNFMARLGGGSTDVTGTVHLKGNKMLQGDENQASLIDLDAERMVTLNHKEKTYSVLTFADFRQMMEEMKDEISAGGDGSAPENGQAAEEKPATELKFDFKIDPTGEKSTVNGHRAERFLMTILMEAESTEKPKEGETAHQGTLVIASDLWMSEDLEGHSEIAAFQKRFAEKMGDAVLGEAEMQNLSGALQKAFAGDPRIRSGMEKMQAEAAKMKGVDVKNVTHVVLVAPGEKFNPDLVFKAAAKEEAKPKKRGLGGFAKKLAQQAAGVDSGEKEPEEAPSQQTLLTTTTEMQEYSTASLPESMFEIPSNYREVDPQTR